MKFHQEYGTNSDMTSLWDRLQSEEECCGVTGPEEFSNSTGTTKWEMPPSCCFEPAAANITRCAKVITLNFYRVTFIRIVLFLIGQ